MVQNYKYNQRTIILLPEFTCLVAALPFKYGNKLLSISVLL